MTGLKWSHNVHEFQTHRLLVENFGKMIGPRSSPNTFINVRESVSSSIYQSKGYDWSTPHKEDMKIPFKNSETGVMRKIRAN